jgi:peroxiredoxin
MSDDSIKDTEFDVENVKKDLSWWDRLRSHTLGRWAIDLAIVALIFTGISMWQTKDLVGTGEAAPETVLQSFDGDIVDFDQYKGKKTMVVFWAPWCGVCGAESDNVDRVKSLLGDRINVTSVVLDYQNRQDIQDFIDEQGVEYPVLLGKTKTARNYNVNVFPTLYILDDEGRIEHTVAGYTTTFGMLWRVII